MREKVANKMKNDCREKSKIYSALYFLYESESDVFYVGFEIIDMAFPYFILAIMVLCVYLHYVWIIYFTFNPGIGGKISMDSFQTNFIFSWLTSKISEIGGRERKTKFSACSPLVLLLAGSFFCSTSSIKLRIKNLPTFEKVQNEADYHGERRWGERLGLEVRHQADQRVQAHRGQVRPFRLFSISALRVPWTCFLF